MKIQDLRYDDLTERSEIEEVFIDFLMLLGEIIRRLLKSTIALLTFAALVFVLIGMLVGVQIAR